MEVKVCMAVHIDPENGTSEVVYMIDTEENRVKAIKQGAHMIAPAW